MGSLKCGCDAGIQSDIHVVGHGQLGVPGVDPVLDKLLESLADDGVGKVSNVVAWKLLQLSELRYEGEEILLLHCEFEDIVDSQEFELRDVDHLDLVTLKMLQDKVIKGYDLRSWFQRRCP